MRWQESHLLSCLFAWLTSPLHLKETLSPSSGVNSPPKRGRKCGQSNTEETNTKHAKATTKSDVEGSGEEEPEAGKGTTKGKSGGKKQYFTIPHIIHMDSTGFHWLPLDSTGLDCQSQNWTPLDSPNTKLDWTGLD
ncbi:uncharacterized protein LACBIDRAFT_332878 [Laccaria bicolor S238N-H82]|uniref:Predicted protein n=1 Tax=Laccaria bicolor (strain S238N-H82 / ATCC MYA-4686) TaxID=486041 RepID=B0DU50_LACBS|nr:uncharacterized protein LACBIDRAFT_332878 [Laccaria bicolor S238N-H82]EDR01843.1 predicted protein [Laccaria bicolor S238N-H82]|eukprot:XP_001887453.1 predicted protein [Laccaria bicolor S238N-H82]